MDSGSLIEFYKHLAMLKGLKRTGWLRQGIKDPETVAGHTFGVAALSIILAENEKNVDGEKLLKMAMFHDLGESVSGDITPFDRKFEKKKELELKGLKLAIKSLPEKMQKEIVELFLEFGKGKTKEGKIVKMADKLDMYLMLQHYGKKCRKWKEYFIKDYERFNSRHFTGLSREAYEKIRGMFHEV